MHAPLNMLAVNIGPHHKIRYKAISLNIKQLAVKF